MRAATRYVFLWAYVRVCSILVALVAFHALANETASSLRTFLLSPWYVWDVEYYVAIVRQGYQPSAVTSNFHPLYPWLSSLIAAVLREPLLSLLIVASVAGLLLAIVFYKLATLDGSEEQAWQATALLLASPLSLALFVPYTESLFLLLSVWCLFAARKGQFWIAGAAGALASLTRQQGLFLVLPLAWEAWEASGRNWSMLLRRWERFVAIGWVVVGYGAWIAYRAFAISDVSPDVSSPQRFIYSVMLSSRTYEILNQQEFLPPWAALWKVVGVFWKGGVHGGAYIDVALGAVFIAMFLIGWKYLRMSYRIYSLAIILVSLSFFTGFINPYMSLPRHLLLAFPVFIGFSLAVKVKRFSLLLVALVLVQMGLLCSFVWQKWVL